MARLIAPEYFGLIVIYGAIMVSAKEMSRLGFDVAIVQEGTDDRGRLSSAFYSIITLSFISVVVLCFFADAFTSWYSRANYFIVFSLYSLTILMDNYVCIHYSRCLIDQDLRFINLTRIISSLSGGVIGIGMAWYGFQLTAIIAQIVVVSFLNFIMFFVQRPWFPLPVFEMKVVKEYFAFGSFVYLGKMVSNVFETSKSSILGMNYGADAFAQANKAGIANQLTAVYMSSYLSKILFPVLSQSKDKSFRSMYLFSLKLNIVIGGFIAGLVFLLGPSLILLIYGPQWALSTKLIPILCMGITLFSVVFVVKWGMLAHGFSREQFLCELCIKVVASVQIIASFYLAIEELYMLVILLSFISVLISILFCSYYLRVDIFSQLRSMGSGLCALFVPLWVFIVFYFLNFEISLLFSVVIYFLLFFTTLIYLEENFVKSILGILYQTLTKTK